MNFPSSVFRPLSRGTSVIGDQEFKPDPLKQFQSIAKANPEADRLIMSEDGLDVIAAPKPFFGVSLSIILGASEKETGQNCTILAKFQEALIKRYGTRVTDFAFPDLHGCLLHGSKLDAKTIQRVLNDAQLFEAIFLDESLSAGMNHAVKSDIEADAACMEFEKTSNEHDQLYTKAQVATKNKESAATAVTHYIHEKIGTSHLPPDDPKVKELQGLQTLWRAASQDTPENPNESLKIFEDAANETDPNKRDRFILNRERTRLTPAPRNDQGWTGAAIQWIAGRSETSVAENRRTTEGFRRVLARKYGHTITNFVFPTSFARYEAGSRLNATTIQNVLAKAEKVSSLLKDDTLKSLMTHWTISVQEAEGAEARYRTIKVTREEIGRDKDAKLETAELAYKQADHHILNYLVTHAVEKNITIPQSARLRHLWFDEARARYKQTQSRPSAPLAPTSMMQSQMSYASQQPATNSNYRGGEDDNSLLGQFGAAAYSAANQLADYLELDRDSTATTAKFPLASEAAIPIANVVTVEDSKIK